MPGAYVQGLREVTRGFERAGVDLDDLKDLMGSIATEATETMLPFIPTRSGRLRASARGNRAKGKAVVTIGRATVPYAGPINYGWPKRHIRGANFVAKTDDVMEHKLTDMLADGWNAIAARYGIGG
jgi:hypothetical protein